MHHTHFWEEFIDKGGRPCRQVVNIFSLDIRSGGTEQPACDCVYPSTSLRACVRPCESNNVQVVVWETECVGHVWACVCVWVSSIPIHQSHKWAALCLGRKMNHARCAQPAAVVPLPPFPPDSPRAGLWVGRTHLASHRHAIPSQCYHRKLTHEDARIPCVLIQTEWIESCKTDPTCFSFSEMRGWLSRNWTIGIRTLMRRECT